jgi:hypothetical protein
MEFDNLFTNTEQYKDYDYIINPPPVEGALNEGYVVEKALRMCSRDERLHISIRCIAASLAYWVGLEDPCIQEIDLHSPFAADFILWCLKRYPATKYNTLTYQEYYPIALAAVYNYNRDSYKQSIIEQKIEDKWEKYIKKINNLITNEFPHMCLIEKNNVYRKYVSNYDKDTYFEVKYRFKGDTQRSVCEVVYVQSGNIKYNIIKSSPRKLYKKLYKII